MLQLSLPSRPADLIRDFPLWLEAAVATGVKICLILDDIEQIVQGDAVQEDPVAFLPTAFPPGATGFCVSLHVKDVRVES